MDLVEPSTRRSSDALCSRSGGDDLSALESNPGLVVGRDANLHPTVPPVHMYCGSFLVIYWHFYLNSGFSAPGALEWSTGTWKYQSSATAYPGSDSFVYYFVFSLFVHFFCIYSLSLVFSMPKIWPSSGISRNET